MRRKPSAAATRSETTAELIARISAERNTPTAAISSRGGSTRPVSLAGQEHAVRVSAPRAPVGPPSVPRQRVRESGQERRRTPPPAMPADVVSEDVLADPSPDQTATVVLRYVAPLAARRRSPARRLVPPVVGAVAALLVGAAATGFTLPWPGAVTSATVPTTALVPGPAPPAAESEPSITGTAAPPDP